MAMIVSERKFAFSYLKGLDHIPDWSMHAGERNVAHAIEQMLHSFSDSELARLVEYYFPGWWVDGSRWTRVDRSSQPFFSFAVPTRFEAELIRELQPDGCRISVEVLSAAGMSQRGIDVERYIHPSDD